MQLRVGPSVFQDCMIIYIWDAPDRGVALVRNVVGTEDNLCAETGLDSKLRGTSRRLPWHELLFLFIRCRPSTRQRRARHSFVSSARESGCTPVFCGRICVWRKYGRGEGGGESRSLVVAENNNYIQNRGEVGEMRAL